MYDVENTYEGFFQNICVGGFVSLIWEKCSIDYPRDLSECMKWEEGMGERNNKYILGYHEDRGDTYEGIEFIRRDVVRYACDEVCGHRHDIEREQIRSI